MSKLTRLILAVLVASAFATNAYAVCRRAHVCNDFGRNCRYQDICDDKLDLPSIDVNPLPSLPSVEVKPLPSLDLPPLGTTKCEYKQVNGRWLNVCR